MIYMVRSYDIYSTGGKSNGSVEADQTEVRRQMMTAAARPAAVRYSSDAEKTGTLVDLTEARKILSW